MRCCGGGNHQNNRKMKDWGQENHQDNFGAKISPMLIIVGLLILGFIIYKFII